MRQQTLGEGKRLPADLVSDSGISNDAISSTAGTGYGGDAADEAGPCRCSNFGAVFRACGLHWLLCQGQSEYQRGLLPGWAGDDGMDRWAELRLGESRFAGIDGVGGRSVSVWDPGGALVL